MRPQRDDAPEPLNWIDAMAEFCPVEWDAWAKPHFEIEPARVLEGAKVIEGVIEGGILRDRKPGEVAQFRQEYPGKPPSGAPSEWKWLTGRAGGLWKDFWSSRMPGTVGVTEVDTVRADGGLRKVSNKLRERLRDGTLAAHGVRAGSIVREPILREAWLVLDWDGDVTASRVVGNGAELTHVTVDKLPPGGSRDGRTAAYARYATRAEILPVVKRMREAGYVWVRNDLARTDISKVLGLSVSTRALVSAKKPPPDGEGDPAWSEPGAKAKPTTPPTAGKKRRPTSSPRAGRKRHTTARRG
jgi:hypothetical protein